MEIKRIDSWLIKGFDGISNLMIQRSQNKVKISHQSELEQAISNLNEVIRLAEHASPKIDTDHLMFSLLLQMSSLLLLRVKADNNIDEANIRCLCGYIDTLKMALQRFKNHG